MVGCCANQAKRGNWKMTTMRKNVERVVLEGRKVNSKADSAQFERYQLTLSECKRRGVRFLPRQVMNQIFRKAGL